MQTLSFWFFRGFSGLVFFSLGVQIKVVKLIVLVAILFLTKKKKDIVETNLSIIGGTYKEEDLKDSMLNIGMNVLQVMQNHDRKTVDGKTFIFNNANVIENALKEGKKIIFVTAHYGNWELLTSLISIKFSPLIAIYRKLKHEKFDKYMKDSREASGLMMYEKRGAIKELVRALKNNIPVGLLVDQGVSKNDGCEVDFFLKKSYFIDTAATLSRMYGALIIPVFISSSDYKNYVIDVYDSFVCENTENKEDDIMRCVQKQATIVESVIRKNPAQWFLLHGRWRHSHSEKYNRKEIAKC